MAGMRLPDDAAGLRKHEELSTEPERPILPTSSETSDIPSKRTSRFSRLSSASARLFLPKASKRSNDSSIRINREAAIKWLNDEVQAQQSCRSLPLTMIFWMVFMLTAFGHRHTGTAFEMQNFMKQVLTNAGGLMVTSGRTTSTSATTGGTTSGTGGRRLKSIGGTSGTSAAARSAYGAGQAIGLDDVTTPSKIYDWLEKTLIRLAWSSAVDGDSYVNYFNRVVGGARLMQTRLERDDCPGNDLLLDYFNSICYSLAHDRNTSSMGNSTGFSADSDGVYVYWLDIYNTEDRVLQHTDFLQNAGWLGAVTQSLRVQIVFYNDQVALFTFAEVIFQLERNGQMKKSLKIKVMPTQVYDSAITIMGDVLLSILLFWLFAGECFKIYWSWKGGALKVYFRRFYTYVNWAVLFLGTGLCSFWVYLVIVLDGMDLELQDVPDPPDTEYVPGSKSWHARHDRLDILYSTLADTSGKLTAHDLATFLFSLVLLFKFFEAFSSNPRLASLTETFWRAQVDVFHFMIVFLAIFMNFALGGYIIFGHHLEEWSNLVLSHITSFRALMGDFKFADMYQVAPVSATIWFTVFMILIFIIMLNMLMAIILEVYADVKGEASKKLTLWGQAARVIRKSSPDATRVNLKRTFTMQSTVFKERFDTLLDQEGPKDIAIRDLTRAGMPKDLAREMLTSFEDQAAKDEVPKEMAQVEEHVDLQCLASQDRHGGQQRAPQLAPAAPSPNSGDLENVAAGMKVLLQKLEMLDEVTLGDHQDGMAEKSLVVFNSRATAPTATSNIQVQRSDWWNFNDFGADNLVFLEEFV